MKRFYFRDALTVTFESFPIDVFMACINKGEFLFFYYVAHNWWIRKKMIFLVIYQALDAAFHHQMKHWEESWKYDA